MLHGIAGGFLKDEPCETAWICCKFALNFLHVRGGDRFGEIETVQFEGSGQKGVRIGKRAL